MTAASLVEIVNVRKSFGDNLVLRDVSLSVKRSEVMCLLGRSGSGKTTLLRCINHLEKVDSGLILVDGELVGYRQHKNTLRELPPREIAKRRRHIGMVFQQFNLFPHMTVLQNVIEAPTGVLGIPRAEAIEYAEYLLQRVGLSDKRNEYPANLSGGQQQRAAIARALAMKPKLMLFDEPTSSLDPELIGEVLDVMRMLAADGMTMIVVTHELEFARDVADTIAFMDGGVIAETGKPDEVLGNPRTPSLVSFLSRSLKGVNGRG